MRLVFAGTPEAAVPSLRRLAASTHTIARVITRTDKPTGRSRTLTPSDVARAADELGVPVLRADRPDSATADLIAADAADLGVVVAYGALIREPLLSTPRHGWINLHFSLLPRWRGAAPVQHALIAGDAVTGASVFRLVPALDAGPVFAEEALAVPDGATAGEVLATLADSGAALVARVVDAIADGSAVATAQEGEPTSAPKLTAADGALDWREPAGRVLDRYRGVTPEPGAHTTVDGTRVKVLAAIAAADAEAPGLAPGALALDRGAVLVGTGSTPLRLVTVQPAGRAATPAADWWRGLRGENPAAGT